MPPSECPDMTPRKVAREAGYRQVETSGLLRPNIISKTSRKAQRKRSDLNPLILRRNEA